ncbi:MAG TPA: hypothetical protein VE978_18610, partial [Chitinophagales bacterium]|nr:hypothetical protein [Chitinophagales bacterium]
MLNTLLYKNKEVKSRFLPGKKQLFFISAVVLLQMKRSVIPIFIGTAFYLLPTISCAQKIAGGGFHSLAICSDSTIRAWGYNNYGELGNGTNTDSNFPVQVGSLTGITAIAGGVDHSLALKNNGTVWASGSNAFGSLGNGNNT